MEAFHGPDRYVHERYAGPTTFDYPQEWDAYPGHYRSHNPWPPNFRVVLLRHHTQRSGSSCQLVMWRLLWYIYTVVIMRKTSVAHSRRG